MLTYQRYAIFSKSSKEVHDVQDYHNQRDELGFTDSVRFIKRSPEGTFVEATKDEAVGIAFNSSPYNLAGKNEIEGAEAVLIIETDAGREVSELRATTARQAEELQQADENAIALYERLAQQDEALIEIYEQLIGG